MFIALEEAEAVDVQRLSQRLPPGVPDSVFNKIDGRDGRVDLERLRQVPRPGVPDAVPDKIVKLYQSWLVVVAIVALGSAPKGVPVRVEAKVVVRWLLLIAWRYKLSQAE